MLVIVQGHFVLMFCLDLMVVHNQE
jgi:hypothetical protein